MARRFSAAVGAHPGVCVTSPDGDADVGRRFSRTWRWWSIVVVVGEIFRLARDEHLENLHL